MDVSRRGFLAGVMGVVAIATLGVEVARQVVPTELGPLQPGTLVEVLSPVGKGRASFVLRIVADVLREGGRGTIIDAEGAMRVRFPKSDYDNLHLHTPSSVTSALDKALEAVKAGHEIVVVEGMATLPLYGLFVVTGTGQRSVNLGQRSGMSAWPQMNSAWPRTNSGRFSSSMWLPWQEPPRVRWTDDDVPTPSWKARLQEVADAAAESGSVVLFMTGWHGDSRRQWFVSQMAATRIVLEPQPDGTLRPRLIDLRLRRMAKSVGFC